MWGKSLERINISHILINNKHCCFYKERTIFWWEGKLDEQTVKLRIAHVTETADWKNTSEINKRSELWMR